MVYFGELQRANACGCFVPPDPTVPIVQAGERIIFTMQPGFNVPGGGGTGGTIVEAHIQIQYSGLAAEFGWLLPLPAEPEPLELGTDELFAQLINTTQPKYRLDREYQGNCPFDPSNPGGFGGGAPSDSASEDDGDRGDEQGVLVLQDSIGPYDYAVLRADEKQPMLDWLNENRYFVPAGTDDAVTAYIRPGAFFLALKLRGGSDVGDLQPVVVRYRSDLPMIPIVLTSVAADPDMGVMVWVLGDSRAIPRNYYHTVLNDAAVDYLSAGSNYVDLVTRAADEAPGHRTFVTEYAGTSQVMQNVLDWEGRFGNPDDMAQITDAIEFVNYLNSYGYTVFSVTPQNPFGAAAYPSQTLAVLQRHLPVPAALIEQGIAPSDYYTNISYYLGWYRMMYPEAFADLDLEFDPAVLTQELIERVIDPTLAAGRLFREKPYMTRMFTTLSPDEMTRDPVFSFNPDLPVVGNTHSGRLIFHCGNTGVGDDITKVPATMITADGWVLSMPRGTAQNPWPQVQMPGSLKIQILREEGPPEEVVDNSHGITAAIGEGEGPFGCNVRPGARPLAGVLGLAFLGLLAVGGALRRRRAR